MDTSGTKAQKNDKWFTRGTIVAVVLAVISIISSVIITNYFRDKKELSVILTANEQIIQKSKSSEDISDIKVLYKDTELINPAIVKLTVKNTGNVDILASDFLSPVYISFGGTKIYDCYLSSESVQIKDIVSDSVLLENDRITVNGIFLLKGEEFAINLVAEGVIPDYDVEARILGIKEIKTVTPQRNWDIFSLWMQIFVTCLACFSVIIVWIDRRKSFALKTRVILSYVMIVGCSFSLITGLLMIFGVLK